MCPKVHRAFKSKLYHKSWQSKREWAQATELAPNVSQDNNLAVTFSLQSGEILSRVMALKPLLMVISIFSAADKTHFFISKMLIFFIKSYV